jgi:hypothetical protein
LDAEQDILDESILFLKVMDIIGDHQRDAGLFRDAHQFPVDNLCSGME